MTTKHVKPAVATDTRPSSADQAPGGDAHAPALKEGWTGEPEHGPLPAHKTEAEAEKHSHGHMGMVKVHKDGQDLHVHPETLEAHRAAGWHEV